MSDARSLISLSETDYDTIAGAVMETARGRWFLAEFAKRNRHADTDMLLTAIGRLERAAGLAAETPAAAAEPRDVTPRRLADTAGDGSTPSAPVLARRLFEATATILDAAERMQEAAWTLRESGADQGLCDALDHRATEIYRACGALDGVSGQLENSAAMVAHSVTAEGAARGGIGSVLDLNDIEVIEVPFTDEPTIACDPPRHQGWRRFGGSTPAEDDVVFEEADAPDGRKPASDEGLRRIDGLADERKLELFN